MEARHIRTRPTIAYNAALAVLPYAKLLAGLSHLRDNGWRNVMCAEVNRFSSSTVSVIN